MKNKDTGEVFDIRDLATLPVDSYSIFPSEFNIPQDGDGASEALYACYAFLIANNSPLSLHLSRQRPPRNDARR